MDSRLARMRSRGRVMRENIEAWDDNATEDKVTDGAATEVYDPRVSDLPHYQSTRHLRHEVRRLGRHDISRIGHRKYLLDLRRVEEDRRCRPAAPHGLEGGVGIRRVGERRRGGAGTEDMLHDQRLDARHVQ